MKGTLFQPLIKLYILRIPNSKLISKKVIPKIQNLTIAFYTHIYEKILKTSIKQTWLIQHKHVQQTIRQAYTNMFYSLGNTNQHILDFIACIICLIGDTLFTPQQMLHNKNIQHFIQAITKQDQKLREYLYIAYTFQTIGYKIGKESATLIFNKFIVSENHYQSNLGAKYKIDLQLKQIKQNMENNSEGIIIRKRLRKRTKNKRNNKNMEYVEQVKTIFYENNIEIEQQNKNNKNFQKFINKCITQGTIDMNNQLPHKSPSAIKLSSFLRTIRHCKAFIKKASQNSNNQRRQTENSYAHWNKVLGEMKNISFLSRKQRIEALSGLNSSSQYSTIFGSDAPNSIPRRQNSINRGLRKQNKSQHQRSFQHKRTQFSKQHVFPNIKKYNGQFVIKEQEDKQNNLYSNMNSRKLKSQLSKFITQRKNTCLS